MSDDKTNRQISRGVGAKSLLGNETLEWAFSAVEEEITNIMVNSRAGEDDLRREARDQIQALRDVKQKLKKALETGKYAEKQLISKHRGPIQRLLS